MNEYKDNDIDFDKIQKALERRIQEQAEDEKENQQQDESFSPQEEPETEGEWEPEEELESDENPESDKEWEAEEELTSEEELESEDERSIEEYTEGESDIVLEDEHADVETETDDENDLADFTAAATIITEGDEEKRRSIPRRQNKAKIQRNRKTAVKQKTTAETSKMVVANLSDYKERILAYRKKKWFRLAVLAVGILAVLLIVTNIIKYWTYNSYSVVSEASGEDTIAASYAKIEGNILKYSLDSAEFSDKRGRLLWSSSYSMNAPAVSNCGDTCIIYDTQGTQIYIFQEDGEIGRITTKLPIVKAAVAEQGVVAAVLESGENTSIEYYASDGTIIASSRTTLDSPGYPLDVSLSEDGLLMAVSYLHISEGRPSTNIVFYNFSTAGQSQTDNVVNTFSVSGHLTPDIEYLDASTCLALRDDGFTVYEGRQIPKEDVNVTIDHEILSVVYNDNYLVFVTRNETSEKAYQMIGYNYSGREVFREQFDFPYSSIALEEDHILMYNSQQMCVYSLSGVCKYEGTLNEGMLNQVHALSGTRYMLVTEAGTSTIKLTK